VCSSDLGNRHGPGGGGSGGVILLSGAPAGVSVTGGVPGASTTATDAYGATVGASGTSNASVTISQTPGTQPGGECATADLAVTNSGAPNPVLAGNNITYTQVVSNNGPRDAVNAVFTEAIPANTVFQSIVAPAGWTCNSTANINSTGIITCTNPDVASGIGGTGTFTVVVTVNAGTVSGTQIVDLAGITSGTSDPNLANNSALVTISVAVANTADDALTNTGSPNPVIAGNNITYTQVVTNYGPAASPNTTVQENLPANTTFVSASGPAGWVCTFVTPSITCVVPSLAVGANATITVVVKVNAGTPAGTVITDVASVSSAIEDSNTANNLATSNVVVATAGQADLAVTSSASPNPVLGGNNITYTQTVTNNGPAAAATVSFTDTVPVNTTFVSLPTPAGWVCSAPPVITCTIASLAVNATASFPLVVTVNSATPPGTAISNTATVSSTTSDPTNADNSATTTVYVASPTQADVAIVKTASPEPVNQGTNLTYTLQVTNNGPAVAQGVSVSDPLPSQVTYVSASTTQGSCAQAAGTVTCNIGTLGVGGLAIITINVNANTFTGSTALAANTATVSATTGDPNLSNNTSTANSTIQSPTAVQLVSFVALPHAAGGVVLEWKTREEVRNLGFNIYREDGQGRRRINPSLIAGSALLLRGGRPQHGAKTYQWFDPSGEANFSYWIEDVDLNGTRTTHGPAVVDATAQFAKPVAQATLLTHLNGTLASVPRQTAPRLAVPRPVMPVLELGIYRAHLEEVPAVKISVRTEGWYRVSSAQLVAAGLDPGADARTLQLFAEGIEQPMRIVGRSSGPLGPNDSIEFYGTGIDTPFSDARVYWLIRGFRPGKRIPLIPAAGSGLSWPQSFPFTVIREDRTTYLATLLNGENADTSLAQP
jgi:uncharacterized repeat protein (TIGR01451 family)